MHTYKDAHAKTPSCAQRHPHACKESLTCSKTHAGKHEHDHTAISTLVHALTHLRAHGNAHVLKQKITYLWVV